ncbi:MAG TPA: glycerophosphodiester phosphodiesterase, partial [Microthrixaceae bacterium]|nr:glycerophosphodiester phosphodiesterase [Microthrixaceae bacterium]
AAAVAADHGHDAFHPWDPFVTPELLEDCRSRGLRVNSWTVNEPERWSELVSWGVDGIITDTPGRLVSALA